MSNPPTIECLCFDHWRPTPVFELEPGHIIRQQQMVAVVSDHPYRDEGAIRVPSEPYDDGPIKLLLGESSREQEAITAVMDYVGSALHEFDDGTAMIAELAYGDGYVFTPRLPIAELERFCYEYMDRYEAFFDQHQQRIDQGELIAMKPFWSRGV